MLFRQKYGPAHVTTMIERTCRFLVALKNAEKRTKPIMAQIAQALMLLPRHACRSITFDRGSEFVDWPHLQAEVGTQTWLSNRIASVKSFCKCDTSRAIQARQGIGVAEQAKPSFINILEAAYVRSVVVSAVSTGLPHFGLRR